MARPLILRILGDASGGTRAIKEQRAALQSLNAEVSKTAVNAQRSVNAQIAAAQKRDARLREEIRLFHAAAAAAVQGSREQVAAANLAARAEAKLAASIGVTERESRKLATTSGHANREFGKSARGALAGSGAFKALGRSLAFASGGFLIFATASNELRKSLEQAREAAVTQRQLEAQFRASGQSLEKYSAQIETATQAVSRLAGFEDDELTRAFIVAFRQTQNVTNALRIQTVAAEAARGTGKPLETMTLALTKAYGGQTTALRRLGVLVPGHTKGMAALEFVHRRFAGQMEAGTSSMDRFHAALFQTEEVAGKALLPTVDRLTNRFANWLSNTKNQVEVQRQLKQLVSGTSTVVSGFAAVIKTVVGLLGGWRNAIISLSTVWLAFKVKAIIAAQQIAAANLIAAGVTASAWKAALISTGWGAFAVAAGLAAGYVISHWDKVKVWFIKFQIILKQIAKDIAEPFSMLPGAAGKSARELKVRLDQDIANLRAQINIGPVGPEGTVGTPGDTSTSVGPAGPTGAGYVPAPKLTPKMTLRRKLAVLDVALAKAMLTATNLDERAILKQQMAIYRQLALHATNLKQRKEYWEQVGSLQSQIQAIDQENLDKEAARQKAIEDAAKKRRAAAEAAAKKAAAAHQHLLRIQLRRAKEELSADKKLQSTLEQRVKNITGKFRDAIDRALTVFGQLGQGPILSPSQSQIKGTLGVHPIAASTYVADLKAQNKQGAQSLSNIHKILAGVTGTEGTSKQAKARRALRAKLGVDLQSLPPEELAALASSPAQAQQFIAQYAARQKLAKAAAKIEMSAQLVTLHATQVRLANLRGKIAAETQVVNHIRIEIDGRDIRPRKVTTDVTTRRGRQAGVNIVQGGYVRGD